MAIVQLQLNKGTKPSGTINITTNGTHNVTNYSEANVQVPSSGPSFYIGLNESQGTISKSKVPNFPTGSAITTIPTSGFMYEFYNCTLPTNTALDWSGITTISGTGCNSAFRGCTGLTSVDLSNLVTVTNTSTGLANMFYGSSITSLDLSSLNYTPSTISLLGSNNPLNYICRNCTSLIEVDISSLQNISAQYMFAECTALTTLHLSNNTSFKVTGSYICQGCTNLTTVTGKIKTISSGTRAAQYGARCAFKDCTSLTTIDLSELTSISQQYSAYGMFQNCSSLTSIDLSSLTSIGGNQATNYMFAGSGLQEVRFSALTTVQGSSATNPWVPNYMFQNCASLTDIYFNAVTSTTFQYHVDGNFSTFLDGCDGVTVHFPSNLQTIIEAWTDTTSGFGGVNTTVLYDLPATE